MEVIISIVGTKKTSKQDEKEFIIYNKEEVLERVSELLDEGYGYSVIQSRKDEN